MKEYDLVIIGTGSAMNMVDEVIRKNPKIKIAVIDKDEPGGICLTRGCIPSKIMVYPAELVRSVENAKELGVELKIERVSYKKIMKRMRYLIDKEINAIKAGLSSSKNIDYYQAVAKFVAPYTLSVNGELIKAKMIFLTTGSRPYIPKIHGLEEAGYQTSDSIIRMALKKAPKSMVIIGGGYIAAEFGHFFSACGTKVTIIGRNPQFLPDEEPEVSQVVKKVLGKHVNILTGYEVYKVEKAGRLKRVYARQIKTGKQLVVDTSEILVAAGRAPNNDILEPEKAGIELTQDGWIKTNEYLETSQPNVYAFGDADGGYLFKHVANYEAEVVYQNAFLKRRVKVDYHAVPHAVFTYPEVASVGLKEGEAIERYGEQNVLIGFERYEDTAKGEAMNAKHYFVKVILTNQLKILGAHIVGPYASILIQEVINLMYTREQSALPLIESMHIHPSLSEVVQRACSNLMTPAEYHHVLSHYLAH